ncbi:L-2-hydroxyglutarate oxidase [Marinomonas sp. M1K-6]|uniref:L-2-hydroxyglutarate oxidase n=1 Tax=Marinomonas profundi TaxID=2726122 RepID=A0A847QUL9_9GAMM|nr:L-2-hydroxyglutarate oxidase [Marinomonas profundi]NLQ16148.1 L-2-hydroxyglutarate oxidase [Marinomonas profundi]UDV03268.1 L-2-hydroxyglutarate oxidase [Marinomonas profundi]
MSEALKNSIYDIAVIGAGIVGLSTAWQLLQRYPKYRILLIEKEDAVGQHQTGHNSGVIHAGVYYAPGSLKADFCQRGAKATKDFCRKHDIEFDECGKLLVATNAVEKERMDALYLRCQDNGLAVHKLDQAQLKAREPNVKGVAALFVPSTGIVNYQQICQKLAELFVQKGGELRLSAEVIGLDESHERVTMTLNNDVVSTSYLVSCGGLMADRLTKMLSIPTDFQIIPFRGEYYQLPAKHNKIVNHLIYPIPDPDLPFLGVHLTRMIDGSVTVGPNAVQGWKREGYGRININLRDIIDMVRFPGFWKLLMSHWRTGLIETKNSWYKPGYLAQVQKYCDLVSLEDLQAYPAGIRAQAVMKDGSLVHDFLFVQSARTLHVCNAPSPAATSAFPIGAYIIDKLDEQITSV